MSLSIVPIDLAEAVEFVRQHHRHHPPPSGHKASLAVSDGEKVVGVAIIAKPVARALADGWTLEVTRVATDGTRNACSKLYGACWRLAQALGYKRLVTYTLPEEGGASLRAVGWRLIGKAGGGTWNRANRPRVDKAPLQAKLRWEVSTHAGEGER